MSSFEQLGTEIGALVDQKNAAYGNSFVTCGQALQLLYPAGIQREQMQSALLLVRIWDKMMRVATDNDPSGESPFADIAGYGILGTAMQHSRERRPQDPCGSVNDVASRSKAPAEDSAATAASEPTMPSASATSAPNASGILSGASESTFARKGAPAPTATGPVCGREAVLARARARNERNECAGCNQELGPATFEGWLAGEPWKKVPLNISFRFCCAQCREELGRLTA